MSEYEGKYDRRLLARCRELEKQLALAETELREKAELEPHYKAIEAQLAEARASVEKIEQEKPYMGALSKDWVLSVLQEALACSNAARLGEGGE